MKKRKIEIEITDQEIKDLKLIRNYFGKHDITGLEHMAYAVLDSMVNKITVPETMKYKVKSYMDNIYVVIEIKTEITKYRGSPSDCESWIRLIEHGYLLI